MELHIYIYTSTKPNASLCHAISLKFIARVNFYLFFPKGGSSISGDGGRTVHGATDGTFPSTNTGITSADKGIEKMYVSRDEFIADGHFTK